MATATDPTSDVRVPDPSFMDDYDTGGTFVPPPEPKYIENGRTKYHKFVALAPSADKIKLRDGEGKFLKTREGMLKAVIEDITLVESRYKIGQTHIGTGQYNKYDRKTGQPTGEKRNASPALDYLHGHGIDARPATAEEYEQLFGATADRSFEMTGEWSAYDSDSQSDVARKWEDFPLEVDAEGKETGRRQPFIEKNGKRFWARLSVKRYVSTLADGK